MSLSYTDLVNDGGCCESSGRVTVRLNATRRGSAYSFSLDRYTQVNGVKTALDLTGATYLVQLFSEETGSAITAFSYAISVSQTNHVDFTLSETSTLLLAADVTYIGDIVETLAGGSPNSLVDIEIPILAQRSA